MNIRALVVACFTAALCAAAPAELRVVDYAPANTAPTFDHGYLIVYESAPSVRVHGPDGNLTYRFGPEKGQPLSLALRNDGTGAAAVANWMEADSGAIVYLDRSGSVRRVVETPGYTPVGVSFSEDGSLWVLGARPPGSEDDYHLVRHYSNEGRELGRYVQRSSIGGKSESIVPITGGWQIRTSQNRVGIYLFNSDPRLWIEITIGGVEQGRWVVDFDGHPAAFTRNGDVFAESVGGQLKLDRGSGKWESVSLPVEGRLVGAEADDLVWLDRNGTINRLTYQASNTP
jgi:hypothetical protein